jgi:3-phenylpropionate/trans-cinnamate dioxygenase ferredoxin reductase subunit
MIAIVGGGAAGASAAVALRQLGYDGPVRLYGAEAVAPYERPVLSKGCRLGELSEPPALWSADALAQLGIALELGSEVVALDLARRTLLTARGEEHPYERLLLATGAEPRRLDVPHADAAGVHVLRSLADARALRAALPPGGTVAVVGGGVIGLEVAAAAVALGASATVIEAAPQLMGRVAPPGLAALLADLHRARGVAIRTGAVPVGFEASGGRVRGVALADGTVVPADVAVVGVGAVPRTELAARAGLVVGDGVVVDEALRSGDEHVFAAGDVASVLHAGLGRHVRIEQWLPAQEQGRRAAASMLGVGEPYREVPSMWSDQGDLHLQAVGFGFGDDVDVVRRGAIDERAGVAFMGVRDGRLVAACGLSRGTGAAKAIRVARMLVESGVPVDAEQLADPAVDLRRLALAGAVREPRG